MNSAKKEAQIALDSIEDSASWNDIMYTLYVKQKISEGRRAREQGKVHSHEDVKKQILGNEH